MADLIITERSNIVALADAIREKTGTTGSISLGDMISDVEVNIKSDPILQDKSVTPTDETQVITADDGYDGLDTVTVNGDTNLKAENIAEGISIFGVEGTHSGGGSGGASVGTCAVEITTSDGVFTSVTYSCLEGDKIVSKRIDLQTTNIYLENIICGTFISLGFSSTHLIIESQIGAEILKNVFAWHIIAEAGETAIIKLCSV